MYLAIEGVIGVGKTSLARLLQPVFNAELLLEVFEENPFLSDFYSDRQRYAFQTQIYFLLSRYRQQHHAVPQALSNGDLISDYTFAKDALFAGLNLSGDEIETYRLVHDALAERIPLPDLIVYLRVTTDVAMQRISMRDRPYERNMEYSYIEQLNQAYEEFFDQHDKLPVLIVDSTAMDFVSRPGDLGIVADRVRQKLQIPPYQQHLPLEKS
ncbi:MAG: deoxynucleoside kinase [Anaerolineae bacterium]|nr:MAG: deoxynucleoside kinase [Anaerolineae bacterium]